MIDGVKIDVSGIEPLDWLNNNLLDFYTYANTATGELKDGTQIAQYKGLTFVVTPSKKHPNLYYYSVRGSLHKYHNQGYTNANDFTISQLQEVIKNLQNNFKIDPDKATLRNVEFGVNIRTDQTAKSVINNLVALNSDPFTVFSIERKKLGKAITKTDYKIKAYDKGRQENKADKHLLRLEVAVKRMQYLKKYGIATLADLVNINKVQPLGAVLSSYWKEAIYYDKAVKWREMRPHEQKKLLYYVTPRNWADFDRKQRLRAKQHFKKIIAQYGTTSTHAKTSYLIAKKWQELTAENCPRFAHDLQENESKDLSTFCPLECTVKTYPYHQETINTKKGAKTPDKNQMKMRQENSNEKGAFCRTCGKDISRKKSNALYCSKRCNNSYHAKLRKWERHRRKKAETKLLQKLLGNLHQSSLSMVIEFRTPSGTYASRLEQWEICTSWDWIRRVIKVIIDAGPALVLTSYRAKRLIKEIDKNNWPIGTHETDFVHQQKAKQAPNT